MTEPTPAANDPNFSNGGPPGPEPEQDPARQRYNGSRFLSQPLATALSDTFGINNLDPHLQEMLKAAKANKSADGLNIDFGNGHAHIFTNRNGVSMADRSQPIDEAAADHMAAIAKAHGWATVNIHGKNQQEADQLWLSAQRQGLKVANYTPDPKSEIAQKWQHEQLHGRQSVSEAPDPKAQQPGVSAAAPRTEAPAEASPQQQAMDLIRDKIRNSTDRTTPNYLRAVWSKLNNTQGLVRDGATLDAVKQALQTQNPVDSFNQLSDALNKANPGLKIPTLPGGTPAAAETPVDPQAQALALLKEKIQDNNDKSLDPRLRNVYAKLNSTPGLVRDSQTLDAVTQALGNSNARAGFNQLTDVLNTANPDLKLVKMPVTQPLVTRQQSGPSLSR